MEIRTDVMASAAAALASGPACQPVMPASLARLMTISRAAILVAADKDVAINLVIWVRQVLGRDVLKGRDNGYLLAKHFLYGDNG